MGNLIELHTPVGTPNHSIIRDGSRSCTCDAKVGELDTPILVGQYIGTLDIPMDNTLVMQVHEPLQDLGDVHCYEIFRELAEPFAYTVQ